MQEIAFSEIGKMKMQNGDRLKVHSITNEYRNRLSIGGAVYQPGTYEFKEGMTAHDLLERANGVKKDASLNRGLIFRTENRVDYQTLSFSVKELIEKKNDIPLKDNDSIHIFYKDSLQYKRFVKVEGAVNSPKELPFMENMKVEDVIALAGGLSNGADPSTIEVFREINDGNFQRLSTAFKVSSNNELLPEEGTNTLTLQPNDIVSVRYIKGFTPLQTVSVMGEVVYPGVYSIQSKNDRISDLLERVGDLRVISRARPLDKARLVNLLQQKGEVVAVTGDGTNDAPALKAAQVGLSMGDGTSVAKEASDITILDNSFSSIGKAVMWGRSLYLNIQRFILFQMTINVAACIIVLIGAFLGVESPLTVTQMLWVNLIMDTFAALALASLPPSHSVMHDKPRPRKANIISRPMAKGIFGVGGFFVLLLFGFIQYFKNEDITTLAQFSLGDYFSHFFHFGAPKGSLSPYELSLFFSIFVLLQFWNMFNAKAYRTGKSAFHSIGKCQGFLMIAVAIILGQIFITSFGGEMFSVTPLKLVDWAIIIAATSIVLWIGEIRRAVGKRQ